MYVYTYVYLPNVDSEKNSTIERHLVLSSSILFIFYFLQNKSAEYSNCPTRIHHAKSAPNLM